MSNNKVTSLPPFVFANLTRLSTLIISYNDVKCIHKDAFAGLDSLRILSLHGNDISMIPEGAFTQRKTITHLCEAINNLCYHATY